MSAPHILSIDPSSNSTLSGPKQMLSLFTIPPDGPEK